MKHDYIAVDLKINEIRYKLIRISRSSDGSIFITPSIKNYMERTLQSKMQDIHISEHASGRRHVKIRGMDMNVFKVKDVTLEGNFLGRWYICINPLGKKPEEIFDISAKAPSTYLAHYDMILEKFPVTWFTILVREFKVGMELKMRSEGEILSELEIPVFGTLIQILLCEGNVEIRKSQQNLAFDPKGTTFPFMDKRL